MKLCPKLYANILTAGVVVVVVVVVVVGCGCVVAVMVELMIGRERDR